MTGLGPGLTGATGGTGEGFSKRLSFMTGLVGAAVAAGLAGTAGLAAAAGVVPKAGAAGEAAAGVCPGPALS